MGVFSKKQASGLGVPSFHHTHVFCNCWQVVKREHDFSVHSTGDRDSLAFICLSRKPVGASASRKTQEIIKNIKNQRAFENNIRSFRGNHDLHLQFVLPLPLPMFVLYA